MVLVKHPRSATFRGGRGLHKGDNVAPEALARCARLAEDAGFESLWVGDHIALPADARGAVRPIGEPRGTDAGR